jgi:hypothetical protein
MQIQTVESKQFSHALEVPLTADSVDSPIVNYGGGLTSINFLTKDERWGRVTFEKLDSIKVSRGEYELSFPRKGGQGRKCYGFSYS